MLIYSFLDIEKSQLNFIKKHQLSFVVIRKKAAIPTYFDSISKNIIVDSLSGDQFIILK